MRTGLILYIIGLYGIIKNRKNIIIMLISIEIILISTTYILLTSNYMSDDILTELYSIYIISIAGAESALGLGIIVSYYNIHGNIIIKDYN